VITLDAATEGDREAPAARLPGCGCGGATAGPDDAEGAL